MLVARGGDLLTHAVVGSQHHAPDFLRDALAQNFLARGDDVVGEDFLQFLDTAFGEQGGIIFNLGDERLLCRDR